MGGEGLESCHDVAPVTVRSGVLEGTELCLHRVVVLPHHGDRAVRSAEEALAHRVEGPRFPMHVRPGRIRQALDVRSMCTGLCPAELRSEELMFRDQELKGVRPGLPARPDRLPDATLRHLDPPASFPHGLKIVGSEGPVTFRMPTEPLSIVRTREWSTRR